MDMPDNSTKTEFGELISGILLSMPIIVIEGFIISKIYEISSFSTFIKKFDEISFIFKISLATLIFSAVLGALIGLLKDKLDKLKNLIRVNIFKKIDIDDKCSWRKMFLEDGKTKYVRLIINGEELTGFVKSSSVPGEEKELIIYKPSEWNGYPEMEEKFTRIDNIYINLDKNIIIKEYNQDDYNSYCDELNSPTKE